MTPVFHIQRRPIGGGAPCFIIAEAGVNHDGDSSTACELVRAAARAGADAVKFQTFRADEIVTGHAPTASYQRSAGGDRMREMLARLELPLQAFAELRDEAERSGLIFLSTPFDATSARYLAGLSMAAFKVPSGEITNVELLDEVSRHGRPVLLSTGASTQAEVAAALARIAGAGAPPCALLHCVSAYPAPADACNLRAIATLRDAFGVPVGFSDHTLGREVAIAAVAMGAAVLEKHFTLDRGRPGPDHHASLDPDELASMVREIRRVEAAMGDGRKRPQPCEEEVRSLARRSVVASRPLRAGHVLVRDDLAVRRPGTGLQPDQLVRVVGKRLARDLDADQPLAWEDLNDP